MMIITVLLTIFFYLPATTSLIIPSILQERQSVCGGDSTLSQCGGSFPSSFCCPTGTTCYGFNNNQSVICCPQKECSFTNALSCNPEVYDATAFPAGPIHMTNLSQSAYTSCGTSGSCCPIGYSCGGGGCQRDSVFKAPSSSINSGSPASATASAAPTIVTGFTNSIPPSAVSTRTNTPAGTNLPAVTGSATGPAIGSATAQTTSQTTGPQFPTEAILVGLFPGFAAGLLLAFLIVCCLSKRKARKLSSSSSDSLGPTIAKISDPIYIVNPTATRTDFLRHHSRRIVKKASRPLIGDNSPSGSSISRMRSLFRKTPKTAADEQNLWGQRQAEHPMPDPTSAAERALNTRLKRSSTQSTTISSTSTIGPRTPKPRRELSMESIPIYNNTPDAGGYNRDPMFADLLPAMSMNDVSKENGRAPRIQSPTVKTSNTAGLMPPIFLGSPLSTRR